MTMDSGDRIEVLWSGGVTPGIYADHRDGGRVIVDVPDQGPTLMIGSEFGRPRAIRGGMPAPWGTPLDLEWVRLHEAGEVDDTTRRAEWTANEAGRSNSSGRYEAIVADVARLLRNDAHNLIAGHLDATARLIVSQLAHVHGLAPRGVES